MPVVVDDRHVGRDHDLVADAYVMPHVHGHPAVDGHVVADRQPGAVRDGDAHRRGFAKRREPLAEYRLAPNMELYLPPDIRESAEPCGSQLSSYISAAGLREKTREVVKPEVYAQGILHGHLCQIVMSGRHDPAGVSGGLRPAGRHGRRPPTTWYPHDNTDSHPMDRHAVDCQGLCLRYPPHSQAAAPHGSAGRATAGSAGRATAPGATIRQRYAIVLPSRERA